MLTEKMQAVFNDGLPKEMQIHLTKTDEYISDMRAIRELVEDSCQEIGITGCENWDDLKAAFHPESTEDLLKILAISLIQLNIFPIDSEIEE